MSTNWYDKIHNMDKKELAQFLAIHGVVDGPWSKWFNENYCIKCDPVEFTYEGSTIPIKAAKCELTPHPDDVCKYCDADYSEIIAAWLESEVDKEMLEKRYE